MDSWKNCWYKPVQLHCTMKRNVPCIFAQVSVQSKTGWNFIFFLPILYQWIKIWSNGKKKKGIVMSRSYEGKGQKKITAESLVFSLHAWYCSLKQSYHKCKIKFNKGTSLLFMTVRTSQDGNWNVLLICINRFVWIPSYLAQWLKYRVP